MREGAKNCDHFVRRERKILSCCIDALRSNLLRQGRAMKDDIKKSPCMKENFLALSTLSECYKALQISDHNNKMFANLMFIGHHPMVTINPGKVYLRWSDTASGILDSAVGIVTPEAVVPTLLSDESGVFSTIVSERMAAQRIVNTFVNHTDRVQRPAGILAEVLPEVIRKVNAGNTEINQFTPKDLGIFNTPKGQLFTAIDTKDNSNKRNKHQTGDEKWEEQVRREIEEKKAQKLKAKGVKKEDPAVTQMLKEENSIRENVRAVVNNVEAGLVIFKSICALEWELLIDHFPAILQAVDLLLDHIKLKTLHGAALATLEALCRCTKEPIDESFATRACNLYMKSTRTLSLPDTETKEFVECVYDYCSNGNTLNNSAMLVILPVLNHVLNTSSDMSDKKGAASCI